MGTEDKSAQETPELEYLSEELEEALALVHGATEELPPLDELAAVLEAMGGLAQMGAVVQSLRKACEGEGEAGDDPVEDSDPQDVG
jgi:hypothetical protein